MATNFDPDKYLEEKTAKPDVAFDPDKYIAEKVTPVSMLESGIRGAAQGASMGFADEITGALEAAKDVATTDKTLADLPNLYTQRRDESRKAYDVARESNPGVSMASEMAGGLLSTIGSGGVGAGIKGAALAGAKAGSLYGLGAAEGTAKEQLEAAAIGGATGGLGGAAITGIGKVASPVVLRHFAERKAVGALKDAPNEVRKAIQYLPGKSDDEKTRFLGRWLLDKGLITIKSDPSEIMQAAAQHAEKAGSELAAISREATEGLPLSRTVVQTKYSPVEKEREVMQLAKEAAGERPADMQLGFFETGETVNRPGPAIVGKDIVADRSLGVTSKPVWGDAPTTRGQGGKFESNMRPYEGIEPGQTPGAMVEQQQVVAKPVTEKYTEMMPMAELRQEAVGGVDVSNLGQKIHQEILGPMLNSSSPAQQRAGGRVAKELEPFLSGIKSVDDLRAARIELDKAIKSTTFQKDPFKLTAEQKEILKARGMIEAEIEAAIERNIQMKPQQGLFPGSYKATKQDYQGAKAAEQLAGWRVQRDNSKPEVYMKDLTAGVLSTMAAGGGTIAGAAGTVASKGFREFGRQAAALSADKVAKMSQGFMNKYPRASRAIQEAAMRGQKAATVTDYIMQQTDPEYRAMRAEIEATEHNQEYMGQ